jgi:hypothetical protein
MNDELTRIDIGPSPDQYSSAPIFWFLVEAAEPSETSRQIRDVMRVVAEWQRDGKAFDESLELHLPPWFLAAMAPVRTRDEDARYVRWWQSLTPAQQDHVERDQSWSLRDWLDWMAPSERTWFWWDLSQHSHREFLLAVTSYQWPFNWGALRWLLRAAGAVDITAEWEGDWAISLGLL